MPEIWISLSGFSESVPALGCEHQDRRGQCWRQLYRLVLPPAPIATRFPSSLTIEPEKPEARRPCLFGELTAAGSLLRRLGRRGSPRDTQLRGNCTALLLLRLDRLY
jgi:hypothetical protein